MSTERWMLRELTVSYRRQLVNAPRTIVSSWDVVALLADAKGLSHVRLSLNEHFIVIATDARARVTGYEIASKGGLTSCPVDAGSIFRTLILMGAAGCIFVHNHPSGDPTPSVEDVALTERLARGAELLGIRLLDHVVLGYDGHFSFLDSGLINPEGAR